MYQEIISGYSPVGDIFLFVLSGLLLVIARATFIKQERTTKIFIHALLILPIACFANVMTDIAAMKNWSAIVILAFRDIYHGSLLILFFFYEFYLLTIIGYEKKIYKQGLICAIAINVVGIILDCLSPITHWGLYCDQFGIWHDSIWVKPYALFYGINMVFLAILILSRKDCLIRKVRNIMILTQVICVCFIVIESIYGHNSYMALSFALPLFSVLTMLHSNSYNIETGSLGDRAFDDYLQSRKQKADCYLCIRFFTDDSFVMPKDLGKIFYSFYNGFVNDGSLFNPANGIYVLAIKKEKNADYIEAVDKMINEVFPRYYTRFEIDYKVLVLDEPKAQNINQYNDIMFYFLQSVEVNEKCIVRANGYEKYDKAQRILEQLSDIAVKMDLCDERVRVFLQPIRNVKKDCFDTAEALMRLNLPEIGMVFPDEFIPLAEKAGYIHSLTLIILNKVSKLAHQLLEEGYEFERISINVSDVELDSSNFIKEFEAIVQSNHISFERIGVELTESRNDSDYSVVQRIITQLKALGTPIYLDDFGTGYSNFERILKLRVEVIKIDRSLLLMADQNEEYKRLINFFAGAFSNLGYEVVFEGVENDEHVRYCIESHADFLQGYHFSKPIPMDEIRSFFVRKHG